MNITIFIGDYAGYDIAEEKIGKIESRMRGLAALPHVGTIRNEIHPGLRVATSAKAVICFAVDDSTKMVEIVCVSYGGADWQARVRERREQTF